jgi:hypothetical protein
MRAMRGEKDIFILSVVERVPRATRESSGHKIVELHLIQISDLAARSDSHARKTAMI